MRGFLPALSIVAGGLATVAGCSRSTPPNEPSVTMSPTSTATATASTTAAASGSASVSPPAVAPASTSAAPAAEPTFFFAQTAILEWIEPNVVKPNSGERRFNIHVTLDGHVAMIPESDGVQARVPLGMGVAMPLPATVRWRDYRSGEWLRMNAVIESPTIVRIVGGGTTPPGQAGPSAEKDATSAQDPASTASSLEGSSRTVVRGREGPPTTAFRLLPIASYNEESFTDELPVLPGDASAPPGALGRIDRSTEYKCFRMAEKRWIAAYAIHEPFVVYRSRTAEGKSGGGVPESFTVVPWTAKATAAASMSTATTPPPAPPSPTATAAISSTPSTADFDTRSVDLPATPAQIVDAGDGRYLLMTYPGLKKIGVFDVRFAATPRYLDVDSPRLLVAGGMTRFVVYDVDHGELRRYRLETLELEKKQAFAQNPASIAAATMGAASEGPLFYWDRDQEGTASLRMLDLETLAAPADEAAARVPLGSYAKLKLSSMSTSDDGKTVAVTEVHRTSGHSFRTAVFRPFAEQIRSPSRWIESDAPPVPTSDGLALQDSHWRHYPGGEHLTFYNAARLGVTCHSDELWFSLAGRSESDVVRVRFHKGRDLKTLTELEIGGLKDVDRDSLADGARYSPSEKRLVFVRTNPDQVIVKSFDAEGAIAAAKTDYLAFTSSTPEVYIPGRKLAYQFRTVSGAPSVSYRLVNGPDGMTMSPTGLLEWNVPASVASSMKAEVAAVGAGGAEAKLKFTMKAGIAVTVVAKADVGVDDGALSVTVPLPGKIDRLAVGARGKYLLAAIGSQKLVAVVDVRARKIAKTLPMDDDLLRVAGGATKFVVYCGRSKQLHRYDFASLEREATASIDHEVDDIALGCASEGPVLTASVAAGPRPYALATLRPVVVVDDDPNRPSSSKTADHVTAAADGRHFVHWQVIKRFGGPDKGAGVWALDDVRIRSEQGVDDSHVHLLSAEGSLLHTERGRYNAAGKLVWSKNGVDPGKCVPAVMENYYLMWPSNKPTGGGFHPLVLHAGGGDDEPLATLAAVPAPEMPAKEALLTDPLRSMRLIFIPSAAAVVSIPVTDDRLIVYRADVDELLKTTPRDYLFAASLPPAVATVGKPYEYQLDVKSKHGRLTYRLDKGPEGMSVSATGLVSWTATARSARKEPVVVRFSDVSGAEAVQSFEIETIAELARETRLRDVVTLDGTVNRTILGGGGRYLVLYFADSKKVAVADLVARQIIDTIALDEEPRIAAGREKFFLCLPKKKQFVRYDLATCKPEQSTVYAEMGDPLTMLTGSDSTGPILFAHRHKHEFDTTKKVEFLDPATLLPRRIQIVDPDPRATIEYPAWTVSADGRSFSHAQFFMVMRLEGDSAIVHRPENSDDGAKIPGADGEILYGRRSTYADGTPLEENEAPNRRADSALFPAARGPLVLGYQPPYFDRRPRLPVQVPAAIFVRGDARPQLTLLDVETLEARGKTYPFVTSYDEPPTLEERIVFAPHLNLIATIPHTFDRIFVYEFDFDAEVKRRTDEYLFVYATAPAPVEPGKPWSHQLDVRSKHGGLTYRLEKAPAGAAVSPTGRISWTPPAGPAVTPPLVVIVRDSTGREVTHTLRPKSGGSVVPAAEYRTWASSSGQFTITAALVELKGDMAVLKGADGRIMEIPLDKLSPADQAHARSTGRKR